MHSSPAARRATASVASRGRRVKQQRQSCQCPTPLSRPINGFRRYLQLRGNGPPAHALASSPSGRRHAHGRVTENNRPTQGAESVNKKPVLWHFVHECHLEAPSIAKSKLGQSVVRGRSISVRCAWLARRSEVGGGQGTSI
jgi:hypothetical protein